MKINTVIFNPDEKEVLIYSLFGEEPELQRIMKKIITSFEKADLNKLIKTNYEKLDSLTLILEDKEKALPQLSEFYSDCYGFKKDISKKTRLETGIFYIICKILIVRCYYRKGLNKLLYAATFPELPGRFIPLYLFRLGSIYIEQGKIQEAYDILHLALQRCKPYTDNPLMAKLELLISYQLLRINIIQGNLINAKWFIDDITRKLQGDESLIFAPMCGSYYRWSGDLNEGYKILNKAYRKYKGDEEIKETYARSWFNVIYQLASSLLEMKKKDCLEKAEELIGEASSITEGFDYRNLGYCENTLGRISMEKGNLEKAQKHFEDAYNFFEKYTDYRNMARSKRNLGSVLFRMKKYQKAIVNLNQSLDYDHHTQLEIGAFRTLLEKIDIQIELIQYFKAREYIGRVDMIKLPLGHFLLDEAKKRKELLEHIPIPQGIIGESPAITEIKNDIQTFSQINDPLLIAGETGSGKSFLAQEVHTQSKRKGELKIINCQTISPQELEVEIFGYSGDGKKITGLLEKADRGTVLIKNIAKLPVSLQVKLTRFIDEKRIGGSQGKELDIKMIFTTSDMRDKLAAGDINRSFYDKISDFFIKIPPLRKRREDIRKLVQYFYIEECNNLNKYTSGIQICALNLLEDYPWPGNVRELQKTVRRCVIKLKGKQPITKDMVLSATDYSIIKQSAILSNKLDYDGYLEELSKSDKEEIIARLKTLEEHLKKEEEPPRTRITDSYSIINEVFRIIQEKSSARKAEVVTICPESEKSFHHWINILKDRHEVITVEDSVSYKTYSPVTKKILNKKLKAGEISKAGDFFTVVEQ